ncbi:MAG: hypothetical protein F6K19_32085 [Cyanothece sp. SIO1E1]|nr:hypothetical protein [Cyanothece sp. SIO1E1]
MLSPNPNLLLVKRITAINPDTPQSLILSGYQPDDNDPYDDNTLDTNPVPDPIDTENWPTPLDTYIAGAFEDITVQPGDEIEYTIYFLSDGDTEAQSVMFCDLIPEHVTFNPTAFNGGPFSADPASSPGLDLGIVFNRGSTTVALTNASDGDGGEFFPAGTEAPATCNSADFATSLTGTQNTTGAVVINAGDIPRASVDGINAYGFFRFRAIVQ